MTRTRTAVLVAFVACAALIAGAAAPAAAAAGGPSNGGPGHGAGAADATTATPTIADAAQSDELNCSYPRTFTDAGGADVQLDEEPQAIVTLNPSAAQTLWEIGAKDKVVGVSAYASYLDGADERTNVTGASGMTSAEKVVDLDPDLVLAPNTISNDTVDQLRNNDLAVYQFASAASIDDVYDKTERIGELAGACEGATETVEWMQTEIDAVQENVSESDRPSVYFEFFGTTPGAGTFQHDVITTAGGENVAAEAGLESWAQLSDEKLIEQNPDYLLLLEGSAVPDREAVQSTSAVQNDRIIRVDTNYMQQPAPRVVYAIQEINEQLQQYEGESSENESSENGSGADESDGGDSVPGFGVAPAVAALLTAGVLARRRN
ncbi:PGF-CTERM-anchored ABC transporter substrate-binding protein [Natronoarchaeum mannanilyticum]|uniref:PGF-CTERM-anchored ABC transporter substrate-binding protein n=2 Tax=Natronoarchaeum mannanilyticum TaxID=926360 RepID=A0AAV3TBI2_9EURY